MELVELVEEKLKEYGLEIIKNPHISLTKTVVLQYHWIQRFVNDVKSKLSSIQRFLSCIQFLFQILILIKLNTISVTYIVFYTYNT